MARCWADVLDLLMADRWVGPKVDYSADLRALLMADASADRKDGSLA